MLRRKKKAPSNYLPLMEHGFGLWEVWCDHGEGTIASPVFYDNGGRQLYLTDKSAAQVARAAAANHPERRFCVKSAAHASVVPADMFQQTSEDRR